MLLLWMSTQIQKINYIPTLVLRYWFLIWGTLSKPNHARPHPPDTNELVYCFHSFLSTCKKFTSCINSFLRYWSFRNPAIWLMEIIVGHNSRIKILSDMKFAMGSHKLQGFSFQTIFRKIIVCIGESTSLKNTTTLFLAKLFPPPNKTLCFWTLFAQIWAKMSLLQKLGGKRWRDYLARRCQGQIFDWYRFFVN